MARVVRRKAPVSTTRRFVLVPVVVALVAAVAGPSSGAAAAPRVGQTSRSAAWVQNGEFAGSDLGRNDLFGQSVAVAGSTAVVGALYHGGTASFTGPGSAYVFEHTGTAWVQTAELTASDGALQDRFGVSVAISGTTIAIGASDHDYGAGAVYVFTRSGSSWTQTAEIHDPLGGLDANQFGKAVAVAGDTLIVSAPSTNTAGGLGAVHFFKHGARGWKLQQTLLASNSDGLGSSLAIDGSTALIGAQQEPSPAGPGVGAAYVYTKVAGQWVAQAMLTPSDGKLGYFFGSAVAISGSTAVVGAQTGGVGYAGEAYVFEQAGSSWVQTGSFTDPKSTGFEEFGGSVGVSNSTVVVGAAERRNGRGAAFVYTPRWGGWVHAATLVPSDATGHEGFGAAVAIEGTTIVVGAPEHKTGRIRGNAYAFGSS